VVVHVKEELLALAATCEVDSLGTVKGWVIDTWLLTAKALSALGQTYTALLRGDIDAEIKLALAARGVDVEQLFSAAARRDVITRSDLTELLGAAAAISIDGWPLETMLLPNVPKGSRSRSESGIDILSVALQPAAADDNLTPDEALYIGSVKHTTSSPRDLRQKLNNSVTSDLSMPYLASQLRVFHGRLTERGLDARRVYLFLGDDTHLVVAMIGAVDSASADEFKREMAALKPAPPSGRCRHLLVPQLATLQNIVDG
jgi:hypothetical protein